jgi:hypothetical protein
MHVCMYHFILRQDQGFGAQKEDLKNYKPQFHTIIFAIFLYPFDVEFRITDVRICVNVRVN